MTHKREFVPLESRVNTKHLRKADTFRLEDFQYSTTVREKKIDWLCLSRLNRMAPRLKDAITLQFLSDGSWWHSHKTYKVGRP
jgi:hypothetical protein